MMNKWLLSREEFGVSPKSFQCFSKESLKKITFIKKVLNFKKYNDDANL